jgi:hypothetical protein
MACREALQHSLQDLDPLQSCPVKLGDILTCEHKASVVVAEIFVDMIAAGTGVVRYSTLR